MGGGQPWNLDLGAEGALLACDGSPRWPCHCHCAATVTTPSPPLRCRRDPWPAVQSLPRFLRGFEGPDPLPNAHSGLGVHWIIFGSSGHKGRPSGGVLRAYSRCLQLRHGQHTVVKTIVRTA